MNAIKILKEHSAGKKFGYLLKKFKKYPLFEDNNGFVLSMPPIINSEETGRITTSTKEAFLEVSGFDLITLQKVLSIIAFNMQCLNAKIYSVKIRYPDNEIITPITTNQTIDVSLDYVNDILGLQLNEKEFSNYLKKMGLKKQGKKIIIPTYRTDIMHPIDIAEDIAIAYGYENFPSDIPNIATIGCESEIEVFKRKLSYLLVGFKFQETLTYNLMPLHFQRKLAKMRKGIVHLSNPMNIEYNTMRTNMLLSLLEVSSNNKHSQMPRSIFEIGRVFRLNENNKSKKIIEYDELAVLLEEKNVNYTKAKQVVENIFNRYNVNAEFYEFNNFEHDLWFVGRCAKIITNEKKLGEIELGEIGEINPDILHNLEIENPLAGFFINVNNLYSLIKNKF